MVNELQGIPGRQPLARARRRPVHQDGHLGAHLQDRPQHLLGVAHLQAGQGVRLHAGPEDHLDAGRLDRVRHTLQGG